jgi:hypothetical protein
MVEQFYCLAGIFADYGINRIQNTQRPEGNIFQVSYRRRYKIKSSIGHLFIASDTTNGRK